MVGQSVDKAPQVVGRYSAARRCGYVGGGGAYDSAALWMRCGVILSLVMGRM